MRDWLPNVGQVGLACRTPALTSTSTDRYGVGHEYRRPGAQCSLRRARRDYRVTIFMRLVEVGPSALKHGFTEESIRRALGHVYLARHIIDKDPPRTLIFGFDPDATLLEILVLHMSDRDLVIHCMKARPQELDKALRARGRE